jgi:hypothetical protein
MRFDPTFRIGDLFTAIVIAGSAAGVYAAIKSDLTEVRTQVTDDRATAKESREQFKEQLSNINARLDKMADWTAIYQALINGRSGK